MENREKWTTERRESGKHGRGRVGEIDGERKEREVERKEERGGKVYGGELGVERVEGEGGGIERRKKMEEG